MARATKPAALQTAKMGKEEREKRMEAEEKLKGDDSLVYQTPPGLSPKVAEIYTMIVEELRHANILNNLDIELISTTADAIYRLRIARKHLDKMGEVIMDPNGKLIKSPWVQITKDYQIIFHAGVRELGLSPSSRAKLALYKLETDEEYSEEDEIFDNL